MIVTRFSLYSRVRVLIVVPVRKVVGNQILGLTIFKRVK